MWHHGPVWGCNLNTADEALSSRAGRQTDIMGADVGRVADGYGLGMARGKSHGFSRVAVGTWGIFSSYVGDAHSKREFV